MKEYIITGVIDCKVINAMSFKKLCIQLKTEYPNELCAVTYQNKKGKTIRKEVFNGRVC